jgi:hypothetical protein
MGPAEAECWALAQDASSADGCDFPGATSRVLNVEADGAVAGQPTELKVQTMGRCDQRTGPCRTVLRTGLVEITPWLVP